MWGDGGEVVWRHRAQGTRCRVQGTGWRGGLAAQLGVKLGWREQV